MADRAFVTRISEIQLGNASSYNIVCDVFLLRDTGAIPAGVSAVANFLFTDSLAIVRDKLEAAVRDIATASGYTLPASNGIILPSFQKI